MKRVFGSFLIHPNLYGVVIVSLGCEMLDAEDLAESARRSGREVQVVSIQNDGGTTATIQKGRASFQSYRGKPV